MHAEERCFSSRVANSQREEEPAEPSEEYANSPDR